jgi:hypothetical protein
VRLKTGNYLVLSVIHALPQALSFMNLFLKMPKTKRRGSHPGALLTINGVAS